MSIRCHHVHKAIIKHPLRPMPRASAKFANQRPAGDLYQHSSPRKLLNLIVILANPVQPFGVCKNRNVSSCHHTENAITNGGSEEVMRRFQQKIMGVRNGQHASATQTVNEVTGDVDVRARQDTQRNLCLA